MSKFKRRVFQIVAFGFSNAHLQNFISGNIYKGKWKEFCNPGMNCYSCPAATFSCPIGAMQAVSGSVNFGFSFYVVGFILALGAVFGRAICGFVCPFGFLQELIYKIPTKKRILPRWCKSLKFIFLSIFVIIIPTFFVNDFGIGAPTFCEFICPVGTIEAGIPLLATHPELRAIVSYLFSWKFLIALLTVLGCIFFERFFCKCMCPLGAIYGLLNKISLYKMSKIEQTCINCKKCFDVCPMDVDASVSQNSIECIRCTKCVNACPNKCLHFSFYK